MRADVEDDRAGQEPIRFGDGAGHKDFEPVGLMLLVGRRREQHGPSDAAERHVLKVAEAQPRHDLAGVGGAVAAASTAAKDRLSELLRALAGQLRQRVAPPCFMSISCTSESGLGCAPAVAARASRRQLWLRK